MDQIFHKSREEIWFWSIFVTLGKRCQGFGPARLTPKVADIIPGSPISLEEMPPTNELLAGIVCLSPTLVGQRRGAVVTHVGNIDYKGLNLYRDWKLYSISFPRSSHFLVFPPENCRGNTVCPDRAHEKSILSWNRKLMTYPILCKQWHRWREELKDRRKKQREERTKESIPFINAWPVPTVLIGLILDTREIKDRTLTHLGNSY